MPPSKLSISPPQTSSTSDTPQLQEQASPATATVPVDNTTGYASPVAPPFSPITPKQLPAFPATYPHTVDNAPLLHHQPNSAWNANTQARQHALNMAPPAAEYMPQPPPQPFSSEDSADAIALRAAISSLQFQRKKAEEDIQALQGIRKKAVDDPQLFKSELVAGRLKEQKPTAADLRAKLDEPDSNEGGDENTMKDVDPPFERIPGPQNVVRMPYINWEKYHINGEALDRMHEQQRKWPGSFDYGQDKGREFSVATPYSPWHDSIDGRPQHGRNDSLATPMTVSEHPMETRRGGVRHH